MNEVEVVWSGNACEWRPESVREAYELVVRSWTEAGVEPQQIAAQAPGVGRNYGVFRHKRRFIESAGFENVESIEFGRLPPELPHGCTQWELRTAVYSQFDAVVCGCVPSLVGGAADMVQEVSQKLITLSRCRYAFRLAQPMEYSPGTYACGACIHVNDDWRPDELRYNVQNWNPRMERLAPLLAAGILRDVFPENYLSRSHLEAHLGKTSTSLRDWIEADPTGRGTLEPFNDILTKWTPPIEKIPALREELYRAGRLFYWRFMRSGFRGWHGEMNPEPLYRPDLAAPWEAPDPIPEIYRADYWKDKDPSLTY